MASRSPRLPTSTTDDMPSPPSARICSAVRSARWNLSSATQTLAPSRAKTRAMARPMPWPAPVTIATLPSSRPIARLAPPPPSRSVEPAVEGPGAPLVGQDRVLDGLADATLDRRGDAALLHQLERLVAVLRLGVGVHLQVLHLDAIVLPESLVERLGVAAAARGALARVAEGAQRLLVGAAAVVEERVHGADRLRHRDVAPHLLVRDLEGAGVLDLHQHVIRVTQVAGLVCEVLRPVRVVLGIVHDERVGVGRVGDEERELWRHPEPEVVELLGVALHDVEASGAVADRRHDPVLRVWAVRLDERVQLAEELVDRERPLRCTV